MEIYHQYVKLRKQFGRHPRFVDEGAEMIADIRPNEEHAAECVPKSPMVTITQCVPEMSEHEVNTVAVLYANKAISHVEGGWPKDVDCTEAEHTIRYAWQRLATSVIDCSAMQQRVRSAVDTRSVVGQLYRACASRRCACTA